MLSRYSRNCKTGLFIHLTYLLLLYLDELTPPWWLSTSTEKKKLMSIHSAPQGLHFFIQSLQSAYGIRKYTPLPGGGTCRWAANQQHRQLIARCKRMLSGNLNVCLRGCYIGAAKIRYKKHTWGSRKEVHVWDTRETLLAGGKAMCQTKGWLEEFCKQPVVSLWSISSLSCLFGYHWNIW